MPTRATPDRARSWQRARSKEQIAERRAAILAAANLLFDTCGYEAASLGALATAVGISKSNLYRYFESKEQIFLELYRLDVERWSAALERALRRSKQRDDPDAYARLWVKTLIDHTQLIALNSLLAGVLERNASVEAAADFKRHVLGNVERVRDAVQIVLPSIPSARIFELIRASHALAAGLWPMAHPAPVMAQVMQRPDFARLRVDFARELTTAIAAMVRGVLESPRRTPARRSREH